MKLKNFKLSEDLVGIECGGTYMDVHNNYVFSGLRNRGEDVELEWTRIDEDWVPRELPIRLVLEASGVVYCEKRGKICRDLSEFGFFENDPLGKVEHNGRPAPEPGAEVLVLRFVSGGEIALMASSATVSATWA